MSVQFIVRRSLLVIISILTAVASLMTAQNFQLKTRVDLVVVPTSVRDSSGKLVSGLTQKDFTVLEDGRPQVISSFSADAQPLSAAIVVDTGMGGITLRRLVPLFVSVTGGFAESDQMASFRYDHLVHQLSNFTSDPVTIEKSFDVVKSIAEKQPATVPSGTPAPTAPKIIQLLLGALNSGNIGGPPSDPTKPPAGGRPKPVQTSRVLYDAVYEAAKSLESQPPERRRIIFMISDGQVAGTNEHNLEDTVNLLLRDNIELYAVTTDMAAFEGRFGVLSSYARTTGGDIYSGLSTSSMETAFSRITEEARNKYVIGYYSNNEIPDNRPTVRTIEVKGSNPKWKLNHRKGYTQIP